jgi:protein-ribulosamine 3-kinase
MNYDRAIASALETAGITAHVRGMQPLSGGCIHVVLRLVLDDSTHVIAKVNSASHASLLQEEADGLIVLATTNTVLVPKPLAVSTADGFTVLLMEQIESASPVSGAWERFAAELASLHLTDVGMRYGFDNDNHLGTTHQPNAWCDDWVEFNAVHRLGHQLRLARSAGLLDRDEARSIERVIEKLDRLIPRKPKPALLHGDLWSGNALPAGDRIAVIDPAPSIGDGWADIAMMKLFGGFSSECIAQYASFIADRESVPSRILVYQLYHVLNHVNLFGRGYAAQAMSIAAALDP